MGGSVLKKITIAAAVFATVGLSAASFAAENANPNGAKQNPKSSTAATPPNKKHSAGTVGAMNEAGGSSFTASKNDQKKVHLNKAK